MRAGEKEGWIGVVEEAGLEPGLVGRVLEQAANEIGHAGDHLADGDVLAHAEVHLRGGVLELVGHAVEHLQFECGVGQAAFFQSGEGIGDGADVVRAERELDSPTLRIARAGIEEDVGHALEAGVGLSLGPPDGAWPAHLLGVDDLIVPVRPFHQAHGDDAAGALRPLADAAGVVLAAGEIRLHRKAGLEVDLLTAAHEQLEREVLEGALLHVEVDKDAPTTLGSGGFEDGDDALHERGDRALGIDRIDPCGKGADLDRDVGARDGAEVVGLQPRALLPATDRAGKVVDQIQVLGLVLLGLELGDAGLAEKVHAEGDAVVPEILEVVECARGVRAGDELLSHPGDLRRDLLGGKPLGDAAGLQAQVDGGWHLDPGLGEIVLEVLEDVLRTLEHGKRVDEAEELDLEGLVLHRPFHELVGVEAGAEQAGLVLASAVEHLATDLQNTCFIGSGTAIGSRGQSRSVAGCGMCSGLGLAREDRHA